MAGGIEISGITGFNAGLDAILAAVETATRTALTLNAQTLAKTAVLGFNGQHAKGTPRSAGGNRPQNVTTNLSRSIHPLTTTPTPLGGGSWTIRVAPTLIYGRRIELGFTGTDSIGRHYNQPAFPYLRPAIGRATPAMQGIYEYYWRAALKV